MMYHCQHGMPAFLVILSVFCMINIWASYDAKQTNSNYIKSNEYEKISVKVMRCLSRHRATIGLREVEHDVANLYGFFLRVVWTMLGVRGDKHINMPK